MTWNGLNVDYSEVWTTWVFKAGELWFLELRAQGLRLLPVYLSTLLWEWPACPFAAWPHTYCMSIRQRWPWEHYPPCCCQWLCQWSEDLSCMCLLDIRVLQFLLWFYKIVWLCAWSFSGSWRGLGGRVDTHAPCNPAAVREPPLPLESTACNPKIGVVSLWWEVFRQTCI